MPRPLKKPAKREPQAVTVRRLEDGEPIEVIAPDELARRKQEAEWQLLRRSHGLDLVDEHELLALKLGAAIIVESYTGKLVLWFVRDVNGIDRTITAGTLIFDQPREFTFPFEMVSPLDITGYTDAREIPLWRDRVESRLGPTRVSRRSKRSKPRTGTPGDTPP